MIYVDEKTGKYNIYVYIIQIMYIYLYVCRIVYTEVYNFPLDSKLMQWSPPLRFPL